MLLEKMTLPQTTLDQMPLGINGPQVIVTNAVKILSLEQTSLEQLS
jgi:hypothetical protein